MWPVSILIDTVALRKESVDRNPGMNTILFTIVSSLSARRAWIEIGAPTTQAGKHAVALRKESVDRNNPPIKPAEIGPKSLSARRAWIEILRR